MNRKIQSAKKKRAIQAEQKLLQDTNIEVSQKLIEATERLYELVNGKEEYDFNKLEKQLSLIDKHLDLSQYFTNLERSIEKNSPLTRISKTKIQDFSKLLEAVKENKPIETKIDLNKLEKAVVNIEQYIRENTEKSDQGAEKYQPVRRVVKVGNRFIFDDNFTNAGGGGGSSGGLTNAELRASPVPVSASIDTTGLATATKQDTGNTSLSSIDGKITAVNTGAVVVSSSALPSGAATSAKQDALLTELQLKADLTETQPVSLASVPSHAVTQTTASSLNAQVVGDVAAGATDSGNPVKAGGKYNATNPTLTDGQRGDLQVDSRGNLKIIPASGSNTASFGADNADAVAVSSTADKQRIITRNSVYNGTTWDRMKGDATDGLLVNLGSNNDVSLNAGTNAIGKLSANSGVDIGDVDVTSAVSGTLDHGSNLDIDTSAEQITSTSFACKFGVTVKSAVDNTATVYIGNSDVTDGDTAATDGFPLEPGESITLPVTNSNLLYAIAASANQKVFWIGV